MSDRRPRLTRREAEALGLLTDYPETAPPWPRFEPIGN